MNKYLTYVHFEGEQKKTFDAQHIVKNQLSLSGLSKEEKNGELTQWHLGL